MMILSLSGVNLQRWKYVQQLELSYTYTVDAYMYYNLSSW